MHLTSRILSVAVATALVSWSGTPTPAQASDPRATLGVYAGPANVAGVNTWETALGGAGTARVLDFLDPENWSKIENPSWWVRTWAASPYGARLVYSVPLLPETGGTLAEGAAGLYNEHFRALAELLVAKGQGDVTLRLGWEFNGGWYSWRAAANPTAFVAYWQAIVTTMRSVPGAAFKFDWCPNISKDEIAPDQVYPGDAYVDYIGMDVYDQGWGPDWQEPAARWNKLVNEPYGLAWQAAFASEHGKPISFPEWGLSIRPDGHGGGDDPYYIEHMYEWISTHNVAYSIYFDRDSSSVALHTLEHFPTASATFQTLFGTPATPTNGPSPEPPAGPEPPADSEPPPSSEGGGSEAGGGSEEAEGPEETADPESPEANEPDEANQEQEPAGSDGSTSPPLRVSSQVSSATPLLAAAPGATAVLTRGERRVSARLAYVAHTAGRATFLRSIWLSAVPHGAKIQVSCSGRGCPRQSIHLHGSGTVRIGALRRRKLRPADIVRIAVRRPGLLPQQFELLVRLGASIQVRSTP